jgi:nucleoside 2-deoxyribosyltransferase
MNPDIICNSKDIIRDCDLMVAEVSYPSTGMGIEIGWAQSFGIPILALHRADVKPSSSINKITKYLHSYQTTQDMVDIISAFRSITKNPL